MAQPQLQLAQPKPVVAQKVVAAAKMTQLNQKKVVAAPAPKPAEQSRSGLVERARLAARKKVEDAKKQLEVDAKRKKDEVERVKTEKLR